MTYLAALYSLGPAVLLIWAGLFWLVMVVLIVAISNLGGHRGQ